MAECVITYSPLENPLGDPTYEPLPLANRLPSLKGQTILLLNNGKLTLGKTTIFTDLLKQRLEKEGVKEILDERLLPVPEEYADLALLVPKTIKQIASGPRFDAAILGLGDSGSFSVRIVFLALELERMGIPTVGIYTEALALTAATVAAASCPDLPIVTVMHPTWSASEEEVRRTTEKVLPDIIQALTQLDTGITQRLAAKRFTLAREAPAPLLEKKVRGQLDDSKRMIVEMDPGDEVYDIYERFCKSRLCDGFPIILPTSRRVEEMLGYIDRAPGQVIVDRVVPNMAPVTVRKLAVNAVMAGCKPEYFPIVVTAFEAMAEPRFWICKTAPVNCRG